MYSTLFIGGCRCGKSALALRRAEEFAARRVFIATARPSDAAMRERILRHQSRRDPEWVLEEAPFDVPSALRKAARQAETILLDCVGIWLSNLMERGLSDAHILLHARETARFLERPSAFTVVVAQEVGLGVAPASRLGNRFRDLNGEVNQILAQSCREVVFVACGLPLTLKGNGMRDGIWKNTV